MDKQKNMQSFPEVSAQAGLSLSPKHKKLIDHSLR